MLGSLQVPLQITLRNMSHSDALEAKIRQKAANLEEFHPRLISCRVTLEQVTRHQRQGRDFRVGVDVRLPGRREIVVNREHDEDPYVALREAFDAMKRQLDEVAQEEQPGPSVRSRTAPLAN